MRTWRDRVSIAHSCTLFVLLALILPGLPDPFSSLHFPFPSLPHTLFVIHCFFWSLLLYSILSSHSPPRLSSYSLYFLFLNYSSFPVCQSQLNILDFITPGMLLLF